MTCTIIEPHFPSYAILLREYSVPVAHEQLLTCVMLRGKRPDWFGVVGVPTLLVIDMVIRYLAERGEIFGISRAERPENDPEKPRHLSLKLQRALAAGISGLKINPPRKWEFTSRFAFAHYVVLSRYTNRLTFRLVGTPSANTRHYKELQCGSMN